MERIKKRPIAYIFLMMLSLALLCFIPGVSLAELSKQGPLNTNGEASLYADDVSAKPGETCVIDICIADNPGIIGMTVVTNYDEGLQLTSIQKGEAFNALDMTKPGNFRPGCKIHWDTTDIDESDIRDGKIVSLTFSVPEGAKNGDVFTVNVAADTMNGQKDVWDRKLNVLDLNSAVCKIYVGSLPSEHEHSFGAWSITAAPSCTASGVRERVCLGCDEKVVEEMSALGHDIHDGICSRCGWEEGMVVGWTTCGTCEWAFWENGMLKIRPANGTAGTLADWGSASNLAPWNEFADSIVSAKVEQGVSAVTCYNMFAGCSSLASLDVSGLDTSSATNMEGMFWGCISLVSLDLSSWDTSNVTDMKGMFCGCSSLQTIYASGSFTTKGLRMFDGSDMFTGCMSLVGGMGTKYADIKVEHDAMKSYEAYARFDGGPSAPGYFTAKNVSTALVLLTSGVRSAEAGSLMENSSVATVSGGGSYTVGARTSIVATNVAGYRFDGWHYLNGDGALGDRVSAARNFEFEVLEDVTLVAVYEPVESFQLNVSAPSFSVNGSVQYGSFVQIMPGGQNVSISFDDDSYDFVAWTTPAGNVLSRSAEYTFPLVGAKDIVARYAKKGGAGRGEALVEFVSKYDQIMALATYKTESEIVFPAGPALLGNVFSGWSMDEATVKASIESGDWYVTVRPTYRPMEGSYTVTVSYKGVAREPETLGAAAFGKQCSVTAPTIPGYDFSCWEDAAGNVVSTSRTCIRRAMVDDALVAAYVPSGGEVVKRVPTSALQPFYGEPNGAYYRLSFVSVCDVPSGYEMVECGILLCKTNRYGGEGGLQTMVLGAQDVEAKSAADPDNRVYVHTLNASNPNKPYQARGFVQARNLSTGEVEVFYSPTILNGSYNSLSSK